MIWHSQQENHNIKRFGGFKNKLHGSIVRFLNREGDTDDLSHCSFVHARRQHQRVQHCRCCADHAGASGCHRRYRNTDAGCRHHRSRLPHPAAQDREGPAPVTTITSEDILRQGYQSVPDVLKSLTQNGGETQSQQSYSGNDFTPGAQQVDLRGLGPNHTLVLVNGRRIADFPLPLEGNSNFTDISNIPVGLIDQVQVLSGSASAIYGSDAISGVVNFQLKSKADGTRIDLRYGNTEHGGGASYKLTVTSGWDTGRFHGVIGVELLDQRPLWEYQRSRQDFRGRQPGSRWPHCPPQLPAHRRI